MHEDWGRGGGQREGDGKKSLTSDKKDSLTMGEMKIFDATFFRFISLADV